MYGGDACLGNIGIDPRATFDDRLLELPGALKLSRWKLSANDAALNEKESDTSPWKRAANSCWGANAYQDHDPCSAAQLDAYADGRTEGRAFALDTPLQHHDDFRSG
jgi:hypothetical protein